MEEAPYEPGSFRDRTSRVWIEDGRVLRGLSEEARQDFNTLAQSRLFQNWVGDGRLVDAHPTSGMREADWALTLEHPTLPFISYPYEWPFGMLKDAALLHLDLLLAALKEGMMLKDASPYNLQWRGSAPVFIDIGSFQRLNRGEPWVGYRQFCRLFLYPLMLQAYKGVPFHPWLRGSLEGIQPDHLGRLFDGWDRFKPGILTHVHLQAMLEKRYGGTRKNVRADLQQAGFHPDLIKANIGRLRRLVERLHWTPKQSTWSDYTITNSYSLQERDEKEAFVREALGTGTWKQVWDLGCNTGTFSRIAAEHAELVLALDSDHLAVERLYQRLKTTNNRTLLPLIFDVANPSPGLGWQNEERQPLNGRGRPDLVMALALIHHVVIGAHIPLDSFIAWLAKLGGDLVIEFVHRDDPMVKQLLLNKEDPYTDYQQGHFEQCLNRHYRIERRMELAGKTRTLYFARRFQG